MKNAGKTTDPIITIRSMQKDDLPVVVEMEIAIFPDPWPQSSFLEQLDEDNWESIIAECDGRIIGYACFMFVAGEAHLTNIATAQSYRRKSVAHRLLDYIFEYVQARDCEQLLLEVRPSNIEARAFYKKHGFRFLYERPNYYQRPVENAEVLVYYFDKQGDH